MRKERPPIAALWLICLASRSRTGASGKKTRSAVRGRFALVNVSGSFCMSVLDAQITNRSLTVDWRQLHALADRLDRRYRALVSRIALVEQAWIAVLDYLVARQSDRRYLREVILPSIARAGRSRVLFVGVRGYTKSYGAIFERAGMEFWTCDIDPVA